MPLRFMVRREDDRAAAVRRLGAEVVIGDLTRPETVAAALRGVSRMFFAMTVSPDHLLAATVVTSVAKEYGKLVAPGSCGFPRARWAPRGVTAGSVAAGV